MVFESLAGARALIYYEIAALSWAICFTSQIRGRGSRTGRGPQPDPRKSALAKCNVLQRTWP